jgi:hypothetical protein
VSPLASPEKSTGPIYGRLYLSTKNIIIIGGMGNKYATCSKHVFLIHLEEE